MSDFNPPSPIKGDAPVEGPTLADQAMAAAGPQQQPKPPKPAGNRTGLKVGLAILAGLVITGFVLVMVLAFSNAVDDSAGDIEDDFDVDIEADDDAPVPDLDNEDSRAISEMAQGALAALEEELGALPKLLRFDIYTGGAGYVIFEAQDPEKPENIDQYTYFADRGLEDPDPVNVSGSDPVESLLFDANDIGWEGFPVLLDDARRRFDEATTVELENADGLSSISIGSGLPFNDGTYIEVYFDGGDRHNGGSVEYTIGGELTETYGAS